MKKFIGIGKYKRSGKEFKFSKKVLAENEKMALEKILSLMGSNHKIKRKQIEIEELKELKEKEELNGKENH